MKPRKQWIHHPLSPGMPYTFDQGRETRKIRIMPGGMAPLRDVLANSLSPRENE